MLGETIWARMCPYESIRYVGTSWSPQMCSEHHEHPGASWNLIGISEHPGAKQINNLSILQHPGATEKQMPQKNT